jgi:hypothetical protein
MSSARLVAFLCIASIVVACSADRLILSNYLNSPSHGKELAKVPSINGVSSYSGSLNFSHHVITFAAFNALAWMCDFFKILLPTKPKKLFRAFQKFFLTTICAQASSL